jgi:hypothetical protein
MGVDSFLCGEMAVHSKKPRTVGKMIKIPRAEKGIGKISMSGSKVAVSAVDPI